MNLELNFVPLQILGYMSLKIPPDLYLNLKNQTQQCLSDNFSSSKKYNNNLYGAIEHEYVLAETDLLQKFLDTIIPSFWNFNYAPLKTNKKFLLSSCWINFQKKHEFNPIHDHDGDLSFVIWIQIPFNLSEEKKLSNVEHTKFFFDETTAFTFLTSNSQSRKFGGINKHIIQLSKENEGDMILFKSNLPHMVYPFYTSEDFRISISGNLVEV